MNSYRAVRGSIAKSKRRKKASQGTAVDDVDSESLSSLSGEEEVGGKRKRKIGSSSSSGITNVHGQKPKRRKSRYGSSGKRLLRKYKNFQSCPVQVISLDPEKGCFVMYSDGEVELVSDEEELEELPNTMLAEVEEKSSLEEHEHEQAGNLIVEFTGSSGITLDPRFVHKLIQHLSKAKYNMTPQKYAGKIDEANFPKYPTTSFGLYLASSLERGEKGTLATGSEWAAMDPEEKRPYNEQHKVNMQTYRAAIEAYKPGPVEKVALDTFKKAKQECQRLAKKRLETGAGGTAKPKRPMSAFLYFSQEERARWMEDSSNDKSMRSFQAQAAVKWRSWQMKTRTGFRKWPRKTKTGTETKWIFFRTTTQTWTRRRIFRRHSSMNL